MSHRSPRGTMTDVFLIKHRRSCSATRRVSEDDDVIVLYTKDNGHSHRHVSDYQSPTHGNATYETWPSRSHDGLPVAESTVFTSETVVDMGASRWVYGHMTVVHDPLRTLSVVEPGGPGGCEKSPPRVTVEETAVRAGCLYAQNAGFFNTTTYGCLGNVVSDGRMVRDSGGVQNAQFGIRRDGSLVFGYLSQEDVLDQSNPFVQLVSGMVWLLRNGEVYINQSLEGELNIVEMEELRDFVDVLSARTVVGHDAEGNVVLFHVDGQTLKRGMNLWEVAEFLKNNGVINAINLDGGGSSSFVVNGTLASYPPDICESDSRWRCARPVSTILCVHQRRCRPADCSGHGDCVDGRCRCWEGWRGAGCDSLVCRPPVCGRHGVCTAECLPGYFGDGCRHTCMCFNGATCDRVSGRCTCLPGFLAGLCLARRMFASWRQQHEETCRGKIYLTENCSNNSPCFMEWLVLINTCLF
ncbi:N-acetylglucosamine-1-phosphodiester alpha-N-acetylglucosaminidase-like isoform X4 [Cebidichthys violaceus]|uniref:N-acetylglucosamine-1-phosphodiester alpha-N-acetylglucosaminidase-like isoform X4 n=1 Tax=Cebidichthys violaceus TaxID=271503 RepID=UPI0035CBD400